MRTILSALLLAFILLSSQRMRAADSPYTGGNRLAYLDEINPYYPHKDFAKLTTPQWVGEEGVEAVIILSVDDMRDPVAYERYLRPILNRLKQVKNTQGKAPLSIFTNSVDPKHPQLQAWLKEGLSFEVHTITHPCPCLGAGAAPSGDIGRAKQTYDGCVDLLNQIPNYKGPVAFRIPCCDSMNSVSPRFFSEVMNKTTAKGNFLSIDSSVFQVFTSDDPALPRELVLEKDDKGNTRERFTKYTQFPGYINTIENYPYPYTIGNTIWQFPASAPSDWEAQNLQGKNNPKTVEDMKAAIDCTVIKQGVYTLCFHPHGWIQAEQIVELIDHAEKKHGKKVRFLNFREALERINKNMLKGKSLREHARPPVQTAVRFVDINGDGHADRIHSDAERYSLALFDAKTKGQKTLYDRKRGEIATEKELPPIIRADGTSNGFFIKGDALYWQNEDTGGKEPHHVKKITFKEVLALSEPGRVAPEIPATPVTPAPMPPDPKDSGTTRPGSPHNFTTAHAAPPPPRSPQASRDSIQLISGFRAELVAAEPLVMDPIAFDFGPDGKLWVVEMGDYPSGVPDADGKVKPTGRVVFLEDTDGDGQYDRRTIFLDDLNFPTGIMVWNKGVLITAAPDILYAEDSTPDDANRKADKRTALFTGFNEGNQQHRVNGLRWGMDGWIYLANGDSGGNIKHVGIGETTNINGRDLRIRMIADGTWQLDPQSGQSQFGRDRDDFGNWFGSNNPNPGWHYALEDHYLRRNPHVTAPNPRVDLTSDRTIFPISIVHSPSIENHRITPGTPGQSAVHSSANSLTIYRDDLYGESFTGNAFVSEPVHNLVRRMILKPQGVTFRAERPPEATGEEKREFLASSDPWFRPTTIRTGPDGCLWIADMYRQTIEHPKWIPPQWQRALDLRAGHDMGRIYRIVPVNAKPRTPVRLDKLDAKNLVAAMDSPSGWQRDMVQMMLMWNPQNAVIPAEQQEKLNELRSDLRIMAVGTEAHRRKERQIDELIGTFPLVTQLAALATDSMNPAVRVQSLSTLAGRSMLSAGVLTKAAADVHPRVREHFVRISARYIDDPSTYFKSLPESVASVLLKLLDDPDAHVRQQLAYALGNWPDLVEYDGLLNEKSRKSDPLASKALATILLKDADDPYIVAACMSSVLPHLDGVMQQILALPGAVEKHPALLAKLIDIAIAADKLDALGAMLDVVTQPRGDRFEPWQFSALGRLIKAKEKQKITLGMLYEQAEKNSDRRMMMTLNRVPNVLTVARSAIVDPAQNEPLRLAAIDLYALLGGEQRLPTFSAALADVKSSPAVQQAAASAIIRIGGDRAYAQVFTNWKSYSPVLRAAVLDAMLKHDAGISALLDAMEQGIITRHDIDLPRRQPLLTHEDSAVRERAAKLLGGAPDADRQKVIDHYTKALAALLTGGVGASGDRTRGEQVFIKNCAACHKPAAGSAIGPELSKILDSSPQSLLISILDPNRAVEAKYINYLVETSEGEKQTGIILTETSTSITLASVDGKQRQILRRDIVELRSTGLSLMPQGIEQAITPSDMADLFAYIASTGPAPKKFENNTPRTIEADAKGALSLPASAAAIFGETLIFEQQYRNLGYWSSENDRAVWTIIVPRGGKYEVALDHALDKTIKSNAFIIEVSDQKLTGQVKQTGTWDTYQTNNVGQVTLKAGTHRLSIRSDGPVSGALIDLRTITLTPR